MANYELKSTQFRRERESTWQELERVLRKVETQGLRSLSHDELNRLPSLYRGAVSSLSVARAVSLDKNLLEFLTNLVSRAYIVVYSSKTRPFVAMRDFVLRRLPQAVRRYRLYLAVSTACLALGTLTGYVMTMADVERYYSFVPEAFAQGRTPAASTETLLETLYPEDERGIGDLEFFATFLFTNNAKVGILCFTLGFAAGVPVVLLLFYNGLILGAMAALFSSRDLGAEFWAWVLPHGVTELLAVCLCGAAGLAFGMSIVFPGEHTRLQNLALRGRQVGLTVIGSIALFFIAALIEGFFRRLVQDDLARWALAGATLVLWVLYFGWLGGESSARG
jgi:uncharacterized membrane protein SpoIIM required for sporulation